MVAEVAGRNFQEDFEPILERQNHHLINQAQGIMHIGQRDIAWIRISKQAVEKGFKLGAHRQDHPCQVPSGFRGNIRQGPDEDLHGEAKVREVLEQARASYHHRDARVEGMTDETVDTFYSCTLCQSFAPSHVCVVGPERTGLCGAYNWLDCRASYEINPEGPNQPIAERRMFERRVRPVQGVLMISS